MVSGRDTRVQELATVTGAFVLVCGGVLAVASSSVAPREEPPPEVVEMQEHVEDASTALQQRDYERARTSIEAMCSRVESLPQGTSPRGNPNKSGKPVTLAK
jgi:hypothetical protein